MSTPIESIVASLRGFAENNTSNAAMYRKDFPGDPQAEARAVKCDEMSSLWTRLAGSAEAVLTQPDEQPQDERDQLRDALNAAYRERAHLVALLAAVYPSHIGHTDPAAPDWAVVTLQLPTGQAAWHISADDEDLFQHVEHDPGNAIPWDGHSTVEKYGRISDLTAMLAEADQSDPGVMAVPRFEVERLEQDERDAALAALTAERNAAHEAAAEADKQRAEYRREAALLRARVRELEAAQDERDGDVRAVAALQRLRPGGMTLDQAVAYLTDRFADRIAELDAREAKAGAEG